MLAKKNNVNFSIPLQVGENVIDLFKLKRNFLTSLKNLLFEQIALPKLSPVGDLIAYCLSWELFLFQYMLMSPPLKLQ